MARQHPALPSWLDVKSPWTALVTFQSDAALQGPPHVFHEISRSLNHAPAPVLLSLEDLHWADRSSLAVIASLIDELARHRLVVMATWRNEEIDPETIAHVLRLLRRPACDGWR
jgi:hypothetical protein